MPVWIIFGCKTTCLKLSAIYYNLNFCKFTGHSSVSGMHWAPVQLKSSGGLTGPDHLRQLTPVADSWYSAGDKCIHWWHLPAWGFSSKKEHPEKIRRKSPGFWWFSLGRHPELFQLHSVSQRSGHRPDQFQGQDAGAKLDPSSLNGGSAEEFTVIFNPS